MSQQAVRDTVNQMLRILDNIDDMLGDADKALVERGFVDLHGGYQCDISKNAVARIFPQHVAVYYGPEAEDAGPADTLAIGAVLSHDGEALDPVLVGAVFRPRDPNTRYFSWWIRSVVVSERLEEFEPTALPTLPVQVRGKKGLDRSKANYWFDEALYFHLPLTEIHTPEALRERFVDPLCELYEAARHRE